MHFRYNAVNFSPKSGIIMCMRPANERCRYTVKPYLIGRAHTQNDPWKSVQRTPHSSHVKARYWMSFMDSTWWRHQMETVSALLALYAGNSPDTGEFPSQRPVTRSFDVLFDLRLNKQLNKQSWGLWLETPSRPFWRHSNVYFASFTEVMYVICYIGSSHNGALVYTIYCIHLTRPITLLDIRCHKNTF